jgi:hypothetical protein
MKVNICKFLALGGVVTLFFDFYVSFEVFGQAANRLSQGVNEAGDHEIRSSLLLRVKLADLFLAGMILYSMVFPKRKEIHVVTNGPVRAITVALLYMVILLLINSSALSSNQLFVSLIYLIKFSILIFYFTFYAHYFCRFGWRSLIKTLVLSATFSAAVGIFASVGLMDISAMASNRIEFYGQISFVIVLLSFVLLRNKSDFNFIGVSKVLLWIALLICLVSIALCGKRTPLLGAMVGVACVFGVLFANNQHKKVNSILIFFTLLIVLFFSGLIEKTFFSSASSTSGLSYHYAEQLRKITFLGLFEGVDMSALERLAKVVYSFEIITSNPLGYGFWTSIFTHNFLPDSILQFVMENGVLGGSLVFYWVYKINNFCKQSFKSSFSELSVFGGVLRCILISIAAMSLTVNVLYSFKIVALFFIFYALVKSTYLISYQKGP